MCDTVVFVPEQGAVWFGKNSNREPSEAQFIECHDRSSSAIARPRGLPGAEDHGRVLVSRPAWMWGAEIGANEHGVVIGNEAVFTRLPVERTGHSGMDFLRVALGSCRSAADALEQLIELTENLLQGGPMGHQQRGFRYHSSFVVADRHGAWVLETAGHYWAARRVRGVASISNGLTIQDDYDRVHRGAASYARTRGWLDKNQTFRFADAFSDRFMTSLTGAATRRACTASAIGGYPRPALSQFIDALSDHAGVQPGRGWRSESPCAHAGWPATMHAAQTTSSMIARLDDTGATVWATGTSSPCLSVFKPTPFDPVLFVPRRVKDTRFRERDLWWAHERLHRACLENYTDRRAALSDDRSRFQDACLAPRVDPAALWADHLHHTRAWFSRVCRVEGGRRPWLHRRYWRKQDAVNEFPAP
ncbi:MAG: acyl-CoA--6-aminopenicillanic acid acyltransferase [Myxococcota bacterium]